MYAEHKLSTVLLLLGGFHGQHERVLFQYNA